MAIRKSLPVSLCATFVAALGAQADTSPALMFDLGEKFDGSFNESAFNGAERWREETGGSYREIQMQSAAQRVQFARRLAESGANPIVVLGFENAPTLEEVAPEYPDTAFVLIDAVVEQPNVRSVIFAEHEGAYLVGMIAAMTTQSDTISIVGGMQIPLITATACGYAQGARAVNPDIEVIVNYTGDTPAAWSDPVRGSEIALGQISQGSDVIFAAAGSTGLGVMQAAADEGVFSIGVDSNQNHLHPGSVLTSMLKLVDQAVYDAFAEDPGLETGIAQMDLAAGGVGYAVDEHNEHLISDDMVEAVETAKAAIIAGEISVHDYRSDSTCPEF